MLQLEVSLLEDLQLGGLPVHKYISQHRSEGKSHSKSFHLLVVCSIDEEE